jgi:hypothetical protein
MVHGREGRNRLRRPPVKELEVVRSQPQDRIAICVNDRGVDSNQLDFCPECQVLSYAGGRG